MCFQIIPKSREALYRVQVNEMKYRYITFGQPRPEYMELFRAGGMPKLISEIREKAKERGFKLDFWGSPYGTTEGIVIIWKSDKHLDEFNVNGLLPHWHETRTVQCINGE